MTEFTINSFPENFESLRQILQEKIGRDKDITLFQFYYVDDEGDKVSIANDFDYKQAQLFLKKLPEEELIKFYLSSKNNLEKEFILNIALNSLEKNDEEHSKKENNSLNINKAQSYEDDKDHLLKEIDTIFNNDYDKMMNNGLSVSINLGNNNEAKVEDINKNDLTDKSVNIEDSVYFREESSAPKDKNVDEIKQNIINKIRQRIRKTDPEEEKPEEDIFMQGEVTKNLEKKVENETIEQNKTDEEYEDKQNYKFNLISDSIHEEEIENVDTKVHDVSSKEVTQPRNNSTELNYKELEEQLNQQFETLIDRRLKDIKEILVQDSKDLISNILKNFIVKNEK